MTYEKLFSPIKLRGLELKNRVLMPGMDTKFAHDHIGEEVIAYHLERVRGGCALNMFECTAVHITSRSRMNFGLYNEEQRDEFKKLTSAVHEPAAGLVYSCSTAALFIAPSSTRASAASTSTT